MALRSPLRRNWCAVCAYVPGSQCALVGARKKAIRLKRPGGQTPRFVTTEVGSLVGDRGRCLQAGLGRRPQRVAGGPLTGYRRRGRPLDAACQGIDLSSSDSTPRRAVTLTTSRNQKTPRSESRSGTPAGVQSNASVGASLFSVKPLRDGKSRCMVLLAYVTTMNRQGPDGWHVKVIFEECRPKYAGTEDA